MPKKFDVVIGNPPYQDDAVGDTNQTFAIYDKFMDAAYAVADRVVLITPARFLSNAGTTPKAWNQKMLDDVHLMVAHYQANSDALFPGTDIKGGIVVTYRDANAVLGPIGHFVSHSELSTILTKVQATKPKSLMSIVTSQGWYKYTKLIHEERPTLMDTLSGTGRTYLKSNVFSSLAPLMYDTKPDDGRDYSRLLGIKDGHRVEKWFRTDYLVAGPDFDQFKVILPKANGSGAFGETLSSPRIGEPHLGYTETFIGIGRFGSREVADGCLQYLKTKLARAMLGVLKTTQDNTKGKWKYVPLQDFTANSDIDWTQSIPAIDQQLYKKYGLSDDEITFLETHVKPME